MNWYSPPIYDDYVDDYIITNDNNANDIIEDVLVDEIEVKCKENIKGSKKIIDFDYVDHLVTRLLLSQM